MYDTFINTKIPRNPLFGDSYYAYSDIYMLTGIIFNTPVNIENLEPATISYNIGETVPGRNVSVNGELVNRTVFGDRRLPGYAAGSVAQVDIAPNAGSTIWVSAIGSSGLVNVSVPADYVDDTPADVVYNFLHTNDYIPIVDPGQVSMLFGVGFFGPLVLHRDSANESFVNKIIGANKFDNSGEDTLFIEFHDSTAPQTYYLEISKDTVFEFDGTTFVFSAVDWNGVTAQIAAFPVVFESPFEQFNWPSDTSTIDGVAFRLRILAQDQLPG